MLFKVELPHWGSGRATVVVNLISDYSLHRWQVERVEEYPNDKRRTMVPHRVNTDDYTYRRLNMGERRKYEEDFFRDLLGPDTYKEVLRQTWMQAMPAELKEDSAT